MKRSEMIDKISGTTKEFDFIIIGGGATGIGIAFEASARGYSVVWLEKFMISTYGLFDELLYTVGLTMYDLLAGKLSLGRSKRISKAKTLKRISTINPEKISAGVVYHDGQFDDTRLAINTLQSATELGAVVINYCAVNGLLKDDKGLITGVKCFDEEGKKQYEIKGKQVVNATGVFAAYV